MTYQIIEEAAQAGAYRVLGMSYADYNIVDLVNHICDTTFDVEEAIGRVIVVAYTSAEIYHADHFNYKGAKEYGIKQAEKHPYYQDVVAYYRDYDRPQ